MMENQGIGGASVNNTATATGGGTANASTTLAGNQFGQAATRAAAGGDASAGAATTTLGGEATGNQGNDELSNSFTAAQQAARETLVISVNGNATLNALRARPQ